MEKLRAAINLYPTYLTMMDEMARYTFDDMILWVLAAFKDNENMLLSYQERFLYFLVDEFQDTSGSQNQLLKYLIDYWEAPNVFVVGDDDLVGIIRVGVSICFRLGRVRNAVRTGDYIDIRAAICRGGCHTIQKQGTERGS